MWEWFWIKYVRMYDNRKFDSFGDQIESYIVRYILHNLCWLFIGYPISFSLVIPHIFGQNVSVFTRNGQNKTLCENQCCNNCRTIDWLPLLLTVAMQTPDKRQFAWQSTCREMVNQLWWEQAKIIFRKSLSPIPRNSVRRKQLHKCPNIFN